MKRLSSNCTIKSMERGWILQKKGEYWDGIFWLLTGSIEKQLNGRSLGAMGVG